MHLLQALQQNADAAGWNRMRSRFDATHQEKSIRPIYHKRRRSNRKVQRHKLTVQWRHLIANNTCSALTLAV
jgi:hypothetical protein